MRWGFNSPLRHQRLPAIRFLESISPQWSFPMALIFPYERVMLQGVL